MLNKKGQIYLLAALILGFVIYGLSTVVNKSEQQKIEGDFERLSDNYNISISSQLCKKFSSIVSI